MKATNVLLTAALSSGIVLGGALAYSGQFAFNAQAADAGAPTNIVQKQEPEQIEHEVRIIVDEGNDPYKAAADQLGISLDELFEKLEEGKSIAEMAQENNIDPQQIVDAIEEQNAKWLDEMVASGKISAEDAAEIGTELSAGAVEIVNGNESVHFGECGDELFEDDDMLIHDDIDYEAVAAQVLGISVDELIGMLEGGQTATEIANEKGVDPQVVVDALNAAHAQWLDNAVATGEMTAPEADELRTELAELVTEMMDEPYEVEEVEEINIGIGPAHGLISMGPIGILDGAIYLDVAAETLGIDEVELFEMLSEEKTVAVLAEEKGVTPESVIDAMTAAAREDIADFVQNGWPEGMPCGGFFFEDETSFVDDLGDEPVIAAAAQALGMEVDALVGTFDSDKPLAELATEKGIDVQVLIDTMIAAEQKLVDELVADGELSPDEATEWRREISKEIEEWVTGQDIE